MQKTVTTSTVPKVDGRRNILFHNFWRTPLLVLFLDAWWTEMSRPAFECLSRYGLVDELWKHKHVKSLKSDARRSHSIAKVLPRTFKRSIGTLGSKILSSGLGWISALLDVWFGDWLFVQESTITHNRALLEKEPEGRETASDRPSIQPKVRPTDSPSSLTETQNKYCVDC